MDTETRLFCTTGKSQIRMSWLRAWKERVLLKQFMTCFWF